SAAIAIAAEGFRWEETGRGRGRKGADPLAAIACAEGLRRIIKDQKAMRRRNRSYRIMIGGQAEQIDGDNSAGLKAQALGGDYRPLAARRIEIESIGQNIGDNWGGAEERNHFRRRMIGERRTDHRVTRADLPSHQHEQQRVSATGTADGMAGAAKCRQFGLEHVYFRALDEL